MRNPQVFNALNETKSKALRTMKFRLAPIFCMRCSQMRVLHQTGLLLARAEN